MAPRPPKLEARLPPQLGANNNNLVSTITNCNLPKFSVTLNICSYHPKNSV